MTVIQEVEPRPKENGIVTETLLGSEQITNEALVERFRESGISRIAALSPDDIGRKTGIERRHRLQSLDQKPEERFNTVPKMATELALSLLEKSETDPKSLDIVAVVTTYPIRDPHHPEIKINIAQIVADNIGANRSEAIDVYAGCAGPSYFFHQLRMRGFARSDKLLLITVDHYSPDLELGLDEAIFSDMASGLIATGQDFTIEDSIIQLDPSDAILVPIEDENYPDENSPWIVKMPGGVKKFAMRGKKVYEKIRGGPFFHMIKHDLLGDGENEAIVPHQGSGKLLDMTKRQLRKLDVKALLSRRTLPHLGNGAAASQIAELSSFLESSESKNVKNIVLAGVGVGILYAVVRLKLNRTS